MVQPSQSSTVASLERVLQKYQGKNVLVVCRGDPDPDFLGAYVGFGILAKQFGIKTGCLATAPVSIHNKDQLVWLDLNIPIYKRGMDFSQYDGFGVLDAHGIEKKLTQPLNGMPWLFLIDHHDPELNGRHPEFMDIRYDVGSTSTLIGLYLKRLRLLRNDDVDHSKIATALETGIRKDTNGLWNYKPADLRALSYVWPFVDRKALDELNFQTITEGDMDRLVRAWQNGRVKIGSYNLFGMDDVPVHSKVGMALAADTFFRVKGVNTVLVYACVGDDVLGSLRTCDPEVRPKEFLKSVFPTIYEDGGDCGGHERMGGFRIPVSSIVVPALKDPKKRWAAVGTYMADHLNAHLSRGSN